MMNDVELSMYAITLRKILNDTCKDIKYMQNEIYTKAYDLGIDVVPQATLSGLMESISTILNKLQSIDDITRLKSNFTKKDYIQFLKYTTSEDFSKRYEEK